MKITIDLPDALIKQIKMRAQRDGRSFKDAVADLLRKGLAIETPVENVLTSPLVTRDEKAGLPLIKCGHYASAEEEITADRAADILLSQEVDWHRAVATPVTLHPVRP